VSMTSMAEAAVEKLRSPVGGEDDGVIFSYSRPEHSGLRRAVIQSIEKLSGQPRLKVLYDAWRRENRAEPFFDAAVRLMGVRIIGHGTLSLLQRHGQAKSRGYQDKGSGGARSSPYHHGRAYPHMYQDKAAGGARSSPSPSWPGAVPTGCTHLANLLIFLACQFSLAIRTRLFPKR